MGLCRLSIDRRLPHALASPICPKLANKGLQKKHTRATVQFGYEQFGWDMVETHMDDKNTAARALTLSLGGKKSRENRFLTDNRATYSCFQIDEKAKRRRKQYDFGLLALRGKVLCRRVLASDRVYHLATH